MISIGWSSEKAIPVMDNVRTDNSERVIKRLLFFMFPLIQSGMDTGVLVIKAARACINDIMPDHNKLFEPVQYINGGNQGTKEKPH